MFIPKEKQPTAIRIQIDWKATYHKFSEKHGGSPVKYRGRLLFRDGWMHSATDYSGPEWNPLEKDTPNKAAYLHELKTAYWQLRLKDLQITHRQLKTALNSLVQLQSAKSATLQHVVSYTDDLGERVTKSVDLDLQALETRFDWVANDIDECLQHLRNLTKELDHV